MIKRILFIICLILTAGETASAQQKSVTLRTYFPEPIAAYDRIQFHPGIPISGTCPIGTMAYQTIPSTDPAVRNLLFVCYDNDNNTATNGGEWRILQDAWSHLLTPLSAPTIMDVFLTDNINQNIRIGIGTNQPQFKLTLEQDAGILSIGNLGTDDVLIAPANDPAGTFTGITHGQGTRLIWYPRQAAFRAGRLNNIADSWDDNNIGQFSVSLGHNTQSSAQSSMVLGGEGNIIDVNSNNSVISGGQDNRITTTALNSTIAGGQSHLITLGDFSFIGGGQGHFISINNATILGGQSNQILAAGGVIGGGGGLPGARNIIAASNNGVIIGGEHNSINSQQGAIGGGMNNTLTLTATNSTIIAGQNNLIVSAFSFIGGGGGQNNTDRNSIPIITSATTGTNGGQSSVIGGGRNNINEQISATIVGGENNILSFNPINATTGTIGGPSRVSTNSTIIGGRSNQAAAGYVFIGGGEGNNGRNQGSISANAKIGGGQNNFSFKNGVIGGGRNNIVGQGNTLDFGTFSYILGGESNRARNNASWVGGQNMELLSSSSFLWGHSDTTLSVGSSGRSSQFIVATGKVGIQTTSPAHALDVNGHTIIRQTVSLKNPNDVNLTAPKTSVTIDADVVKSNQLDMTEIFATAEPLGPGDVVMMDNGNNGKLIKASRPYSTNAVGIVSTAPAMIFEGSRVIINPQKDEIALMHQADRAPVALKGRVPVKVTLENGPIAPGDPLTTSSVAGHAMKSADSEKSFGTTIGKALEGFTGGPNGETEGVIITFVTLY